MSPGSDSAALAAALFTLQRTETIRSRCHRLLQAAEEDRLEHFGLELSRLPALAEYTARITRERYPDLRVPLHGRMAHFDAGGVPRTQMLRKHLATASAYERARTLCELVVVSVLLDAGSGPGYRYREGPKATPIGRSEGLAIASLTWMARGGLSSRGKPYEVDAAGLLATDEEALAVAFQVTQENPLVGLAGRAQLLQGLGRTLQARPDLFGPQARLGLLVDALWACAQRAGQGAEIPATTVLATVLDGLNTIWPGRLNLAGVPLGDVWRHPAAGGSGLTAGLVPFHKLSQWLTLSLVEPLAESGLRVSDVDALTGLAEYRNGGLFLDGGVLYLKDKQALNQVHRLDTPLVVEWRALTVALLDRIAALVRTALVIRDPTALPLPAILEGGTWAAGRRMAGERRVDASPPIRVASDGTVF